MSIFVGLAPQNPLNPASAAAQAFVLASNPVANIVSSTAKAAASKTGLTGAVSNFLQNTAGGQIISHGQDVVNAVNALDSSLGGQGSLIPSLDDRDSPIGSNGNGNGNVGYLPSDGGTVVPVDTGNPYLFADIAKAYGMDSATAYQEALSNTSYTRAVADLQRAGLNPILATGQGASTGVYGAALSGSGQVSNGVSSAKGAHTWYNILSNVGTAVGAVVGKGYTGAKAGQAIGTVLGNLFDGFY